MNTIRIYETDSHARQLQARVLSCEESENGWLVELDRTIFYPTGGGQPCDMGTLGGAEFFLALRGRAGQDRDLPGSFGYSARGQRQTQHCGQRQAGKTCAWFHRVHALFQKFAGSYAAVSAALAAVWLSQNATASVIQPSASVPRPGPIL